MLPSSMKLGLNGMQGEEETEAGIIEMTEPNSSGAVPQKILFATDLSSSCDRALDRAAQLANQWQAQLLIVHATNRKSGSVAELADPLPSWRKPPEPVVAIRDQIRRDLREEVAQLQIHVEEGEPAAVILKTAIRERCDLIIVGTPSRELVGRSLLGCTVEQLIRKSPVSVLIVKARPKGPYRHILVGTDFTPESRYGLEVAARSFPESELTLMHAFEMPYRALMSDTSLSQEFAAMEKATIQEFVNESAIEPQRRGRIRTLTEHGPPGVMMGRYVKEKFADLTVIGAYGRGFLFHLLVGGNTPLILDSVTSDVLLVRAHRQELTHPVVE